jgi:hypothetical protein
LQAATGWQTVRLPQHLQEDVMRAFLIVPLLAFATAACSGGGQNQAAGGNAADAAVPVTSQVAAMSEGQRNGVFIRAIRDAGFDCQHVERSVSVGNVENMPAWRATCQGGGEWIIVVAADGSAQVLPPAGTAGGNASAGNSAGN